MWTQSRHKSPFQESSALIKAQLKNVPLPRIPLVAFPVRFSRLYQCMTDYERNMTSILNIKTILKKNDFLSLNGKIIKLYCLVKRGTNSFNGIKIFYSLCDTRHHSKWYSKSWLSKNPIVDESRSGTTKMRLGDGKGWRFRIIFFFNLNFKEQHCLFKKKN